MDLVESWLGLAPSGTHPMQVRSSSIGKSDLETASLESKITMTLQSSCLLMLQDLPQVHTLAVTINLDGHEIIDLGRC